MTLDEWVAEFLEHFGEPSAKQMEVLESAFREVALSETQFQSKQAA